MKLLGVNFSHQIIQADFFTTNLFSTDMENNIIFIVLVTGFGDLTYNTKRNLLGAISISNEIAYHLFSVDINGLNIKGSIKLIRKSRWHSQYGHNEGKIDIFLQ